MKYIQLKFRIILFLIIGLLTNPTKLNAQNKFSFVTDFNFGIALMFNTNNLFYTLSNTEEVEISYPSAEKYAIKIGGEYDFGNNFSVLSGVDLRYNKFDFNAITAYPTNLIYNVQSNNYQANFPIELYYKMLINKDDDLANPMYLSFYGGFNFGLTAIQQYIFTPNPINVQSSPFESLMRDEFKAEVKPYAYSNHFSGGIMVGSRGIGLLAGFTSKANASKMVSKTGLLGARDYLTIGIRVYIQPKVKDNGEDLNQEITK